MPLDGNGGYNPPSPENPVRAGTLIKSEDFNTTIDDIADALSTAMYRDGQGAIESDLDMGHHSLLRVKAVRNDEPMTVSTIDTFTLNVGSNYKQTIEGNFTGTIGGNISINTTGISVKAPDGTLLESDLTTESITLQDGVKVAEHTSTGGVGQQTKSVITTELGLVDSSLLPFVPSQESSMILRTTMKLERGDFVALIGDKQVAPIASTPTLFSIGFVLDEYEAGANAVVYMNGYNTQANIVGVPSNDRAIYADISKGSSRTLTYTPIPGYFIGYAVSDTTIRFWGGGMANGVSNAKLYFFGG